VIPPVSICRTCSLVVLHRAACPQCEGPAAAHSKEEPLREAACGSCGARFAIPESLAALPVWCPLCRRPQVTTRRRPWPLSLAIAAVLVCLSGVAAFWLIPGVPPRAKPQPRSPTPQFNPVYDAVEASTGLKFKERTVQARPGRNSDLAAPARRLFV
jgi:hypothetical protein